MARTDDDSWRRGRKCGECLRIEVPDDSFDNPDAIGWCTAADEFVSQDDYITDHDCYGFEEAGWKNRHASR